MYREPRETPIEFVASLIAAICTVLRALNIHGTITMSYLACCFSYAVFFYHSRKTSQAYLNLFYLFMALVGAYRWSL